MTILQLQCPQPLCDGVMVPDWPVVNHNPNSYREAKKRDAKIDLAWRCPACNLRFVVSNPSALDQGTKFRVSLQEKRYLHKLGERGDGISCLYVKVTAPESERECQELPASSDQDTPGIVSVDTETEQTT